ncbi:hypothetical protein BU26DRAFT_89821 [Trematosphaeria pertusa]|uniref:Uncharacterized protein n=1 Tax=Trematosphaeria pertusa TaxID=390896 RepID=A0A6A6I371_9PLEO|nr:uncharacterized protein BU26DRAFT_89821 [Trematosphaeria pertusa]KAF2244944.1 hypothetical protein BU26DRAFT_89821 [Trematosphaeria pertusa]
MHASEVRLHQHQPPDDTPWPGQTGRRHSISDACPFALRPPGVPPGVQETDSTTCSYGVDCYFCGALLTTSAGLGRMDWQGWAPSLAGVYFFYKLALAAAGVPIGRRRLKWTRPLSAPGDIHREREQILRDASSGRQLLSEQKWTRLTPPRCGCQWQTYHREAPLRTNRPALVGRAGWSSLHKPLAGAGAHHHRSSDRRGTLSETFWLRARKHCPRVVCNAAFCGAPDAMICAAAASQSRAGASRGERRGAAENDGGTATQTAETCGELPSLQLEQRGRPSFRFQNGP